MIPNLQCPRFTDAQIRSCQNMAVLDVIAAVEVLGWLMMTEYHFNMVHMNEDGFHTRHYRDMPFCEEVDRRRIVFAFPHPRHPGHLLWEELNAHDPEIGLHWSPSRKFRNALELLTALEQHHGLHTSEMIRHQAATETGATYGVTLRNDHCYVGVRDDRLDRAICKAAILYARKAKTFTHQDSK